MIDFLLGVPGKLKTIYDHLLANLSVARTARIDNLDAAISTRAAALTALSSGTWTGARAGRIDLIETNPCSRPPITSGLGTPIGTDGSPGVNESLLGQICPAKSTSHSYAGSGVLNLVVQPNGSGSGSAATCTIVIDGSTVLAYSGTIAASSTKPHVGFATDAVITFDQIPFRTSLSITATGLEVYYKYRKTS